MVFAGGRATQGGPPGPAFRSGLHTVTLFRAPSSRATHAAEHDGKLLMKGASAETPYSALPRALVKGGQTMK